MSERFSASDFREAFDYDPDNGVFVRRQCFDLWGRQIMGAGKRADTAHSNGYRRIAFGMTRFWAHRVAWVIMTGAWPEPGYDVEHRNGDKSDNRWSNLRLATRPQNMANMKPRKQSKGVDYDARRGLWRARIKINYQEIWLGYFKTDFEAQEAYNAAAKAAHGEFARCV